MQSARRVRPVRPLRLARRALPWAFALAMPLPLAPALAAPPGDRALRLRNDGLAQLENERPGEAEATFRALAAELPSDPLPHANLAIALFRQQKLEEAAAVIERALALSPQRADLLLIHADITAWGSSEPERALPLYRRAAQAAPNNPEAQYALYRHATLLRDNAGASDLSAAASRLRALRPENLVVLLRGGQLAIENADRAAASTIYLRVRELVWQAEPRTRQLAEQKLGELLAALESGNVAAARTPAVLVENVLKSTTMWRSSLVELMTGIQAIPVVRFAEEPPASAFGEPLPVRFAATVVDDARTAGRALVAADLDGDGVADVARLRGGTAPVIELRSGRGVGTARDLGPAPAAEGLSTVDLDNDGHLDLIAYGGELRVWRGGPGGPQEDATGAFGLAEKAATAVAAIDFDSEGDLDLAVAPQTGAVDLLRNTLAGPLEQVGTKSLPELRPRRVEQILATDLDRDGDPDLVLVHEQGLAWLDNLRQGRFENRTAAAGLVRLGPLRAAASADFDNDGDLDLALAGTGLRLFDNLGGGRFVPSRLVVPGDLVAKPLDALAVLDADNDGRLDLAVAGTGGLWVLGQRAGRFEPLPIAGLPAGAIAALAAADLDGDGDLDLVAGGSAGLLRLENQGGNQNRCLKVRLRGLTTGNDKNNVFGRGATLEVRAGAAYQVREAQGDATHFGLGAAQADLLRVVWNNGVPQNRMKPTGCEQTLVEEQVLKGSCPFLYTWDGERVSFVTDLLWNAPLGMPLAPGVWNGFDPEELVRVDGARPRDGVYDLRLTEELWEAAYFDRVRLWVVDHPAAVEVASSLRVIEGAGADDPRLAERVHGSAAVRAVAAAWDGRGDEVTARVRARDETYADGYTPSPYQGVANPPWALTFDLGAAPGRAIRLLLDGWVFPADASLNLAVAQRRDLPWVTTRLAALTASGWQTLLEPMGFPPGKTKTMVIDTPPLPAGVSRLRIETSRWLHWDRIAWTTEVRDSEPVVVARLPPRSAELRYRGFSRLLRQAPNAPHHFDYHTIAEPSPWLAMTGRFTRYGDVLPLLLEVDDRMVVMGPGDEIAVLFDAAGLPPLPPGSARTLFLESHGYDKDADRNTWEADSSEPLPFRGMGSYPYPDGVRYPDSEHHRRFLEEYLTRVGSGQGR